MRPMRPSMYPHSVTLRAYAPSGTDGSPSYAGLDGAGGTAVTIRADVQGPKREVRTIADQPVQVDVWEIYCASNPLLTTPDPTEAERPASFRDGAESSCWPGLLTLTGAMTGEAYDGDGAAVAWKCRVELVRG